MLLAKGSQFEYPLILWLLTVLEKKVFKIPVVLSSPMIICSFSINAIF